jgi:hypothetical protein
MELIGCSMPFFKQYIEKQWLPGMTWDNYGYGKNKWNLHHIRYCHTFNLSDPEQQRLCFHYNNLKPMWQTDHMALHAN